MQTSAQPQPATAPALAPAPPVTITIAGADGKTQTLQVPQTDAEVQALRAHREELSNQLTSVASRRRDLSEEIISAPSGASRTGLEDRLRLLDQRILQIETDIASTGRQLSLAPADLLSMTAPGPPGNGDWEEGMAAGAFSVLILVAIVAVYRRFRRRRPRAAPGNLLAESAQRLERVEHAVEAIALEVERVGEGQRFVTRLLSESQVPLASARRIAEPAGLEHEEQAKR